MNTSIDSLLSFLQCGNPKLDFFTLIDGKSCQEDFTLAEISDDSRHVHINAHQAGLILDDVYLDFYPDHLRCRRTFRNISNNTLHLNELGCKLTEMTFSLSTRDDFFYHNENPRIYETMTFPIDYRRTAENARDSAFDIQAGNRWADPGVVCERIGRSPYQPFPALLVGNYHCSHGVLFGTLSQRQCYHNFLLRHAEDGTISLEAFSSFKGLDYRELAPGETITDSWYLGYVPDVTNVETIFNGYTAVLRTLLPPMYGATKINRDNLVWGSWNDGIMRDVTEELLLTEARFLQKHFPTVRWIQLDDGYSVTQKEVAHGLGVPYEGEEGIDRQKFPQGLRHCTNQIRSLGLRPAIWIGGFCSKSSKIYQEHPQWFIDYDYRVQSSAPLDPSQKVVRDYISSALDTLITEYGFDAVKHDFWSYAFEDSHPLLKEKHHSGYEWRTWWLKELRSRLAFDGYLQTGCDIVMGNPFLGEYFTNYRYGIDIGSGNWNNVRTNFLWGAACFATHTSDLFVPNSDSIGLFPGLTDIEAQFCNTYCLVTHTMVEIAGKLSQADTHSLRYQMLKKCACNPNNGQEIFFAGWNYLDDSQKYPRIIYFNTPHFSICENAQGLPLRTAGFFNLEDTDQSITLDLKKMGLDASKDFTLIDVWTGRSQVIRGSYTATLPPHGSHLIAICEILPQTPSLLDADTRIISSRCFDDKLILQNDYASDAHLIFDRQVKSIQINGNNLSIKPDRSLTMTLPEHATIIVK